MSGHVVSLCDRSGVMVQPWIDAGYHAVTVDLQHVRNSPLRTHLHHDVCELEEAFAKGAAIVFAFPPCTDLAVSGARHFQRKGMKRLIKALQVVEACREVCEASGAPYMIENPVSTLATYWRAPNHTFDPADFGLYADDPASQAYTKRTCIWSGGGFIMPQRGSVKAVDGSKMWRLPPSAERADVRSETPAGFAQAVFEANEPWVRARVA